LALWGWERGIPTILINLSFDGDRVAQPPSAVRGGPKLSTKHAAARTAERRRRETV